MVFKIKLILVLCLLSVSITAQSLNPFYNQLIDSLPNQVFGFAILKSDSTKLFFKQNDCLIKYESETHLFVNAPLKWMDTQSKLGKIPHFNFNPMPAQPLGDTVRATRFIDPVHAGTGGLAQSYTGNNVIVGFIDVGIELNHPDFLDANGDTRVLRLWDQTNGSSFGYYGYGKLWDSTAINNGSCTYVPSSDHGSTVVGVGTGNGTANGKNKGVAPDANIIFINLNLNAGYETRITDACDYIFKFADSLGLPAVVNIGIGGPYGGGHDGNDPYTEYVESLLTAKEGRIALASAGNYGQYSNYHLRGTVTSDTTFTWFKPNAALGNIVYFEVYSDTSDSHFEFAIGADKPAPNYGFSGSTSFRNTYNQMYVVTNDTIWNGSNRIAVVSSYREIVDSAYHMEVFISPVDSTNYNFRFMTHGNGFYDIWNSTTVLTNDIIQTIPSSSIVPEIINYQSPDSLNILAAYFMNSEKIISVGNFSNRQSYIDFNGAYQDFTAFPSGKIYPTSSRGPNRLQYMKPDVSANGNLSFAAAALSTLANPSNYSKIIQEGWHIRNGGTSMAAPVISGMAALYLEKCPKANYADFKRDIINASDKDNYTGSIANYSYGYGKPNALKLMLDKDSVSLVGSPYLCSSPLVLTTNSYATIDSVIWSTNDNILSLSVNTPGSYSAQIYYGGGCKAYTDTMIVVDVLPSVPTVLSSTQPDCINPLGEIQINTQASVYYSLGGASQISNVFSNLVANSYVLTVKSQLDTTCLVNGLSPEVLLPPTNMILTPVPTVNFCEQYTLTGINGVSLSGNEAYYTGLNRTGVRYSPGDIIDTSITKLYLNDSLGVCFDEDSVFFVSYLPSIPTLLSFTQPDCATNLGEIQIAIQPNVNYSLGGVSQGSNVFGNLLPGSYTMSVENQLDPLCLVTEPIPVVLDAPVNMTIDPIGPIAFCDTFILQPITGSLLSGSEAYFTGRGGSGIQYNANDVIDTLTNKLYMYDSLGVCVHQDSVIFSFIPGDDATFSFNDFCENEYSVPSITGLTGGVFSFEQMPSDITSIDANIGGLMNYTPGNSYYIRYTTNGTCPRFSVDTVTVFVTPVLPISNLDSIQSGESAVSIAVSNPQGGVINWYSDSLLTNLIYSGNPIVYTPSSEIYVTETVNGCTSDPKRITIYKLSSSFSTSAFTPNNDNVNDLWILEGIDTMYPNNVVKVFNRWGGVIFESERGKYEENSWDGLTNGKEVPTGSYYYNIICNDSEGTTFTGTVSIIR